MKNIKEENLKNINLKSLSGEKTMIALQHGKCFISNLPLLDQATKGYNGKTIQKCYGLVTSEAKEKIKKEKITSNDLNKQLIKFLNEVK